MPFPGFVASLTLAAAPYDAWQGQRFHEPAPLMSEQLPAPLAEPKERARRPFELNAEFGAALPHCAGGGGPGCAELTFGSELALALLLRPTPMFAFGAEARRFGFDYAARPSAARADAVFVGVCSRVYFLERGPVDPFLELAFGGGPLSVVAAGGVEQKAALVPALRSAAGIDLVLSDWLRAGAFLSLTRYWAASASHCDAAGCSAVAGRDSLLSIGATSLGLRLTIAAGEPL